MTMTPLRPMLVLYEPDIPQNTGTALRTCACLGFDAGIVEPAAFPVSDRAFRRAGMDYLDQVRVTRFASFADFDLWRRQAGRRLVLLTTRATRAYPDFSFRADDILLVGRESAGAPDHVHDSADVRLRIPMAAGARSLNVAVAGAMVLGEMRRQIGWTDRFLPEAAE